MEIELQVSDLFDIHFDAFNDPKNRYILSRGGMRSGKTYSILQVLCYLALTNENKTYIIIRRHKETLRSVLVPDFITVLTMMGIYDEDNFNKTSLTYKFQTGSVIRLLGSDDARKLRGLASDVIYFNECTEISKEAFYQLEGRSREKVFIDYNPSDTESYIYDILKLFPEKSIEVHSTFRDNPFLPEEQIKSIEDKIKVSPEWYKVFVLGEIPTSNTRIYNHFKTVNKIPDDAILRSYGLDHGYNDPFVIVACYEYEKEFYFKELCCETQLDPNQMMDKINKLHLDKSIKIYADHSPDLNAMIRKQGYKIEPADKKSIKEGINTLKANVIYYTTDSTNIMEEVYKYMWSTVNGQITDKPVEKHDHTMDSMRYALHSYITKGHLTGKITIW